EEVKEASRHYYLRYSGPGGLTESDDMENWSVATDACRGAVSQSMYFNYQMGLGHAVPVPTLRGGVTGPYTEENARGFYRRWAQFMQPPDRTALVPNTNAEETYHERRDQGRAGRSCCSSRLHGAMVGNPGLPVCRSRPAGPAAL